MPPRMATRAGSEKHLGPPLSGTGSGAHLWGRIFGDEAAAGTLYAPLGFNRGVQLTLEKWVQQLQGEATASGGHIWLRGWLNRSYPRNVAGSKACSPR